MKTSKNFIFLIIFYTYLSFPLDFLLTLLVKLFMLLIMISSVHLICLSTHTDFKASKNLNKLSRQMNLLLKICRQSSITKGSQESKIAKIFGFFYLYKAILDLISGIAFTSE